MRSYLIMSMQKTDLIKKIIIVVERKRNNAMLASVLLLW